uniref:Uncharacterized protein n=1 Tax=Cyphia angustiloba TaxID=2041112 RepID=A0A291F2E5_9ASTR|nr:hypothetical protein Cyp_ang1Pt0174 [Cyphia angustiloba]ATG26295.1 hypothetical protein Cyp_ang1Pt0174 [Cyphia angustiloba]
MKGIFYPYSMEYVYKWILYSFEYLQIACNARLMVYENDSLTREELSLSDMNKRLADELIRLDKNCLKNNRGLRRLNKKISSLEDRAAINKSLIALSWHRRQKNHRLLHSASLELFLILEDLRELFLIYSDKCKDNSLAVELELTFMKCVSQEGGQIVTKLYVAFDHCSKSWFHYFPIFLKFRYFIEYVYILMIISI